jgi:hypothetical protein
MYDCTELRKALLFDLRVQEHMLTSDMTIASARGLWLQNSFWKKFQDEVGVGADSKCLALFKESNKRCESFLLNATTSQDDEIIGEVRSLWYDIVGNGPESNIPLSEILDNWGVGPGASVGARSENFYTKLFDSPLTGTSERLYRYYRYAILAHPTHFSAEVERDRRYGYKVVAGNRLSFVPKTSEVSRSICTEPVLNMFFQKGIGHVLEKQLKRIFRIDLSSQPELNRRLARLGSIDGSFGTIDLSSASDSISLKMLRSILPEELLGLLEFARSPNVIYPDGSLDQLYMVSSMGNGFTFPLQTLLFSTIVVACYRVLGISPTYGKKGPTNWAVFGDDIIVRKDSYNVVARALKMFGFIVNDDKSFNTGYFRESCGGDYFRGHDIRGVYCKSLKHSADVYSVVNRLVRWSARTGILLPETLKVLLGSVKFLPIPYHDGDAEGIKVPYAPIALPRDRFTGAVKYQALVKRSRSMRMPISSDEKLSFQHYKGRREISYNSAGLLISHVGGYIRNGRIGLRNQYDSFKVRRRRTSRWSSWKEKTQLVKELDKLLTFRPHSVVDGQAGHFQRLLSEINSLKSEEIPLGDDWVIVSELYNL